MKFPSGYRSYRSVADTTNATKSCGQIAFRMARECEPIARFSPMIEPIAFETKGRAIALNISALDADPDFRNRTAAMREHRLQNEAREFRLEEGREFLRELGKAGATNVARIGHVIYEGREQFLNLVYIVHSLRNERYFFTGICGLRSRNKLAADMDSIAASLTFSESEEEPGGV